MKMNRISIIFFLFISSIKVAYSQNLELYGKVEVYDLPAYAKVYYAAAGKKFDAQKFIRCDENKNYIFRMNIAEIRKANIAVLFFAIDTAQNTNLDYACVYKVNVGEIVNAVEFSGLKTIKLKTDLLIENNCEGGMYYDAKKEGKYKFVGTYKFVLNDTIRTISLHNIFF